MVQAFSRNPFILMCLLAGLVWPTFALADDTYDVSYVWSGYADSVKAYRDQVAKLLGPAVASDLHVVQDGELFGVIYRRQGDAAGAARVARSHTRLLQRKGLDAAAPVLAKNWVFVQSRVAGAKSPKVVASKSKVKPSAGKASVRGVVAKQSRRGLESAVETHIKQLRRRGFLHPDERTAWSVYDFTTGEKLVTINEDIPLQAASLIKPFVAVAFFHKVKEGKLIYGPRSRHHMRRMIQQSTILPRIG